jgi:hypothetical protein
LNTLWWLVAAVVVTTLVAGVGLAVLELLLDFLSLLARHIP